MEYPISSATVETLPNGLTLILDPDPAAPVVSVQLWVGTGSMHEDRHAGAGISHFLEHMVFKGTRDFDGDALAETVQAAGGHWNAYTSFDRTVYFIDGPAESLPIFLKTLTGLVFFPILPESEFEKEKEVIRREIDMGLDDPDQAATRLLFATAFLADPRRHPVIGHGHLFDALRHEDLVGYHRSRYVPDRCFAVISGDFEPAEARERVMALTAESQSWCGRELPVPSDPPQLGLRRARETFPIPASRIALAWKIPALDHPDAPVFEVLAAMLGRGRSSLLHRRLREERELALEISAFAWTGPGREGLLAVSADAEPAKRDALIEAVFEELRSIATLPLAEDLAKAQRQLAVSQFGSLSSASGRAADLASNWHEARDLDFTRQHLAAIQRVTAADIRRVVAGLTDRQLTLTILDPLEAPAPARITKAARRREDISVHSLPNGLTLALIPDHRVPLVQLQAAVRAGLPSETPATNGLNQLLAATLTKGTRTRSPQQLATTLESLGAAISAIAGNNAMLVQAAGLAPDFAAIAGVFAEVLHSPALLEDVLDREKASQLATLEEVSQDPLHAGFQAMRKAIFSGTGYGLEALGTRAGIEKIDRDALVAHHRRHFGAANLTIAVAGDFDPAEALAVLTELTAPLPTGQVWTAPPSALCPGGEQAVRLPKKQAVLTIGFPGSAVTGPDRHALALIQEYVSDMAGPLFTRIREELGLAYQVGATQFMGYDAGLFTFYLATSPEHAALARAELLAEIGKLAANGIPPEVFDRVRATVLSGLAIQQQSPSAIARLVALDTLFGQPADTHRHLPAIYRALGVDEVRDTAARIFNLPPTVAMVLPNQTEEAIVEG
jgi:zinc protease